MVRTPIKPETENYLIYLPKKPAFHGNSRAHENFTRLS